MKEKLPVSLCKQTQNSLIITSLLYFPESRLLLEHENFEGGSF